MVSSCGEKVISIGGACDEGEKVAERARRLGERWSSTSCRPGAVEHLGVLAGDLRVVEDEHVVRVHVEAGHREVGRAGQHLARLAVPFDTMNTLSWA